jgi:P-type E1-E2 ATPase
VPAAELVPGDVVKLSLGAVVAADVHLTGGEVLLDQSMLTGESVPIEAGAGVQTYAGALVGAARRWPRSRRPECAPSSAAPRNSCAPPMS